MAMNAGSCTITVSGSTITTTGSGMAKAIADGFAATLLSEYVARPLDDPFKSAYAAYLAQTAQAIAAGVVAHIQSSARAHVTSEVLGRMPSSTSAGTNIQPPSAPVDVPIV